MLSQSKVKNIRSLHISKYRAQENKFLVEGEKLVRECLNGAFSERFELKEIYALHEWIEDNHLIIKDFENACFEVDNKQLQQISLQKNPNRVVALMSFIPELDIHRPKSDKLYLALDRIQDPGNLGTIFRLAEWFGVDCIFLSEGSVDPLNPKLIQSGMGSVLRVPYEKINLENWLSNHSKKLPVYGAFLDGESIYKKELSQGGIILIGNESQGISDELRKYIKHPLLVPKFSNDQAYPESLNAATATGIILSEFKRSVI